MFHFPSKQTEKQRNTEKLRFLSQFDRKKVPNSANTEENYHNLKEKKKPNSENIILTKNAQ